VILAVRDVDKGRDVAQDFVGDYEVRPLNLADLESIRAFAAEWTGELDVLINNAGIMMARPFARSTTSNFIWARITSGRSR